MRIRPTIPQEAFIFSKAQFPAIVAGMGAGKTEALITRSIIGKLKDKGTNRAFYQPTYDLIRMIAWPRFEEILSDLRIPYTLTRHPINTIEIHGHGYIYFRSMDTPARIIGYEVADSDVDELDTLPTEDAREVWRRIVSRNRQKKPDGSINTVGVATTPEGFKFVYDRWVQNPTAGYEIIKAPTSSNPHLPEGYIQQMSDNLPPHLRAAYLDGEFVNLTTGTIYIAFDRHKNASNESILDHEPLFVGMDFNVGNMSAVIHVKRNGKPHAVAEVTKGYDTPDMIRVLKERYPTNAIHIFPDASANSRKSNNANSTDIQLLKSAGFTVFMPFKNPPVRDRINAMNAAFHNGYSIAIDKCPAYVRSLEQQAYNTNGEPDKSQGLDHLPDAGGYYIHYEFPIIKPVMTTTLRLVM